MRYDAMRCKEGFDWYATLHEGVRGCRKIGQRMTTGRALTMAAFRGQGVDVPNVPGDEQAPCISVKVSELSNLL
jgi:hypothetical protein